jgi:hypothetical protein
VVARIAAVQASRAVRDATVSANETGGFKYIPGGRKSFSSLASSARLEVENGVYWIDEAWASRDRNVQSCCVDLADCLSGDRQRAQQRKSSTCCDTRTKRLPICDDMVDLNSADPQPSSREQSTTPQLSPTPASLTDRTIGHSSDSSLPL